MSKAYTKADKARAVEVYLAEGATAAALEVGCSRASVYLWLAEIDSFQSKKGEEARAATVERLRLKRAAMVELFADKALELAAAVDPADPNTARFATPAAIFADKHLLLGGLVKRDRDPARLTLAEVEAMVAELEAELSKVAPANRDRNDIDRELGRMRGELEHQIRAEILNEIDQGLAEKVHTPERAAQVVEIIGLHPPEAPNGKPPPEPPPRNRHRRPPPQVGPTW